MLDDKDKFETPWVPHPLPTLEQAKEKAGVVLFKTEFIEHASYVISHSEALDALKEHMGGTLWILWEDPQQMVLLLFKKPVEQDYAQRVGYLLDQLELYYNPEWMADSFPPGTSQHDIAMEMLGHLDWSTLGYEEPTQDAG